MRVLYLSRGGNPHDRRFLMALSETEHEVLFLPMEVSANSEREFVPQNVELLEHAGDIDADGLSELFERIQPNVVHAGPIPDGAYLVSQTNWRPLVSMSWGSDLLVEAREGEGREKAEDTLRASDVLACDCQAVRNAAIELGMPADRIVVFPWGVDLERFTTIRDGEVRKRLGWEDKFVLLSTRSLEPLYGVDLIVEAFINASTEHSSLRLLMLGEGSQRQELLNEIEQAGLSDRVHAPGIIELDKLPSFYQASDLYVSASHSDGTSVSLLESMASGVPAVVSDISSNQEWVVPGETGWWFQDGDETDLTDKILGAVDAAESLDEMGKIARKIAEDRGDWNQNFAILLEAYDLALVLAQPQR